MIAGLQSYVREHQVALPSDLDGATVGIAAEALAGLSSAEIAARLGSSPTSWIVVFDGPARTTHSPLSDGLERRRVLDAVIRAGVSFIVAPALAAAQLAFMHQQRFISHATGADETLLWGDVPVVYDVFSQQPLILRKGALLAHLRLPDPAFVEAALGAGSSVTSESYPLLQRDADPFEASVRALHFGAGSLLRAARQGADLTYVSQYEKALAFVYRQPLLDLDGTILLTNKTQQPVPKDLYDVIGRQLPPETYWYLTKGLLGPELLSGLLWGWFMDAYRLPNHPPGPQEALRAVEAAVSPARQQAMALIANTMHRYFQVKETVNRTDGGENFVRMVPEAPAAPSDSTSPESIVEAAVVHVRTYIKAPKDVKTTDLPEFIVRSVTKSANEDLKEIPQTVFKAARLALREFVEAVLVDFMFKDLVPRNVDTNAIVKLLPW